MAKSPNYAFEKRERERAKALKAAERAAAKRDQKDSDEGPVEPSQADGAAPEG